MEQILRTECQHSGTTGMFRQVAVPIKQHASIADVKTLGGKVDNIMPSCLYNVLQIA